MSEGEVEQMSNLTHKKQQPQIQNVPNPRWFSRGVNKNFAHKWKNGKSVHMPK